MIAAIDFVDLQDNNYLYHAGDLFPRNGKAVSESRIAELSGSNNALGQPVIIEKPKAKAKPKEEMEEAKAEPKETDDKPKRNRKKNAD